VARSPKKTAATGPVDALAPSRANYPHCRRAGDLVFVSALSSRRSDNTYAGGEMTAAGDMRFDIRAQTEAVIENVARVLATEGATLADVVEVTTYLVNMADFPGYNEVYNRYFDAATGPARTTVAVHQLPHPLIRIEIRAVAWKPPAKSRRRIARAA
jgi:2-aminomuconate deaminase